MYLELVWLKQEQTRQQINTSEAIKVEKQKICN